ncbi:glycosyltransferase family 2 protein [Humibacter sp. RRB41]|uniref:glycosyltransferase family 2 protein n=1 Tax=Humibacter sp. RRB41 TaxID=2919946 RepID=UPI001FAAD6B8|nr:glycosyltransferase family 2 protein [Humibacter sp. RRB41]
MRVVAVIVAYNRRELLLECLDALAAQTRRLDAIVVVDNASTDGSADAVASSHPDVDLVRLPVNTGGAGGFAVGIEHGVSTQHADLIWVMDDDTIPTPTALAALLDARASARETPAILGSRVMWTDGQDHPMNTPRNKPLASAAERRDAAAAGGVAVRSSSFVSMLLDADAVGAVGLPIAEYFIWNDDFEFSARVLRHRRGMFVPASVVLHKTKARADTDVDPGERFYYEVRNKLWLFRASSALAWYEQPLYLAATARRWLRTYLRSSDRATISRTFRAGWRDGTRSRPRTNSEFLASLGLDATSMAAFEAASG